MESECCHKHCVSHNIAALFGRILIGAIFILAALDKLNHWDAGVTYVSNVGILVPKLFLSIGTALEFIGGISVILGLKTRWGAFLLMLMLVPATLLFHSFWAAVGDDAIAQRADFVRNIFYFGALLLLSAFGPGKYSFDTFLCHQHVCGTKEHSSCK